jgi:hypothetical protein
VYRCAAGDLMLYGAAWGRVMDNTDVIGSANILDNPNVDKLANTAVRRE